VHLSLTIDTIPIINNLPAAQACNSYSLNNINYTTSGNYTQNFTTSAGCDSNVHFTLTIDTLSLQIYQNGNTLMTNQNVSNHQWIDCDNNTIIAGQNQNAFAPTKSGNYALLANYNTCTDTSNCIAFAALGLHNTVVNNVSISPNPTNSDIEITSNDAISELKLYDNTGKLIVDIKVDNFKKYNLSLAPFAQGVYLLRVNKSGLYKVVKN
jgi:Secretion system C-terminal sorting domain